MSAVSSSSVRRAIASGEDFVLRHQDGDGAWRDFRLQPGRSDAWVTAYAGAQLLALQRLFPSVARKRAITAAIAFLERNRSAGGGWGYNGNCPPDADSTARALLFLRAAGSAVRLRDYAELTRFALPDGAFATYRFGDARGGWCRGHSDVTVVALRALSNKLAPTHVLVRRGSARLARYLRRSDAFASYWWTTPFYLARELTLFFQPSTRLAAAGLPRPAERLGSNAFERALACDVALAYQDTAAAATCVRTLVEPQREDGSWPPAPILRVVDPRSKRIGDAYCRQSPVAADDRAIFTTSTVAGALGRFEAMRAQLYTRGLVDEGHHRIAQPSLA
jgi:hypothetical protein